MLTIPIAASTTAIPRTADHVSCSNCALRDVCMPDDLTPADYQRVDALICASRKVSRGDTLYRRGDAFRNLYAIKAGAFKTVITLRDGREQVTGFQIAGEPLGLEGIHAGEHTADAVALEDGVVCIIPYGRLERLCGEVRAMQRHLHRVMSGEIVQASQLMALLGSMRAEERVSAFLLNLSQRLRARRHADTEFKLRMSREEIGSYLGMKLETVSRMLSRFQEDRLIDVRGKLIRILDAGRLQRI
ncbi:helix-turn-helix domain-containing protein [Bordetella genomosp. 13]|uniref:Crp/Fnr family transcriptional regulator n=1 Tax=Bordetella genomosp. 13 TaxID=463040 RepID=A0A1W6Z876_9BORD|nr:helix-turn-helix domain-containing protein [Bordetella genomosp. 13]ARP93034.1 Crp/Fnr family transcriptional regulator [Bordetella genomosp. 13]